MSGIFGWSYPPGAADDPNAPYNQDCDDWWYCPGCSEDDSNHLISFDPDEAAAVTGLCPTCKCRLISGETDDPWTNEKEAKQ